MNEHPVVVEFAKQLRLREYAYSSIMVYCSASASFLGRFGDFIPSKSEIEDYLLEIKSPTYRKHTLVAIKNLNKYVCGNLYPVNAIAYPDIPNKIPEIWTPQEVRAIIAQIENTKHRAIINLIYSCALRVSEPCNVKIKDISKDGNLHIRQSKGAKDRVVPVTRETMELLRSYIKEYFENKWSFNNYLFVGQTDRYSPRSIQQILKRAIKKAKVKFGTVHTLRHSRATHWINAGIDLHNLSKLLGHKDIKTTEIYLHTGSEDLSERLKIAEELIIAKSLV